MIVMRTAQDILNLINDGRLTPSKTVEKGRYIFYTVTECGKNTTIRVLK